MMRIIWLAEQKHRAEKQALDASLMPMSQEDEDIEEIPDAGPSFSNAQSQGKKACIYWKFDVC
jgi:hypothetical protein